MVEFDNTNDEKNDVEKLENKSSIKKEENLRKESPSSVNLCFTVHNVIEENNLSNVQTVQGKEKKDKETTKESPNATTINATTIIETLNGIFTDNNFTKPTTPSKLDVEESKVFTSENEEQADNFIEERLIKEKESKVLTERNPHSTLIAVIVENNLSDVQTSQQKRKQDTELTDKSSTATAISTITAVEILDKKGINNNLTTSIPITISKFDARKTKVLTPEKEKEADNVGG